jgi:hypothetical protein
MTDLPTVTCEENRFMERRTVYAYDSNASVVMGDRVRVDNRQGVRVGTIGGIDFLRVKGRIKRRLQIRLDKKEQDGKEHD